jgi:uncharacterized membrane-anchored protein
MRVAPVDPVDPLRGRYVALAYPATEEAVLAKLPGWDERRAGEGRPGWLTLAPAPAVGGWQPVAIAFARPSGPAVGRLVVRGRFHGRALDLGADRYFVDDRHGAALERALVRAKGGTAELRVDAEGQVALVGLRIGASRY